MNKAQQSPQSLISCSDNMVLIGLLPQAEGAGSRAGGVCLAPGEQSTSTNTFPACRWDLQDPATPVSPEVTNLICPHFQHNVAYFWAEQIQIFLRCDAFQATPKRFKPPLNAKD